VSATPGAVELLSEPAVAQADETPRFARRLLRRPIAVICLAYLAVIALVAVIAPLAMPWVAHEQAGDLLNVRRGPSWSHLLGTDSLGRDELERVLVGARITMIAVVEAIAVAFAISVPIGVISGYFGGMVDRIVGWLVDLTLALPGLIIVLVVITVLPNNTLAAMATLGVLASPGLIRIIRSAVLPVREELYVAAARVSGLSRLYIMRRHVLPRIAGPIIVQASLFSAGAILVQVALAYLGLLSAVPAPSWGQMLGDGLQNIVLQPWLIWPPGAS
jgi:peptide/nickel transport system permease protein